MTARRLALIEADDSSAPAGRAPAAGTLRVAIATQDMKFLNAHFGSARTFAIYDVTADSRRFVEAVGFSDTADESGSHRTDGDDRIGPKVAALQGCHLLFVLAIGGPAAAKVVAARMHPLKLPAPEPIDGVLARVQAMLSGNPPPWLRKILHADRPRDFTED
ncbi:nitrogen fixation protein NifX [Rhodospirillum centenum]|uniref:Nitrogenase molybdenum-iron protein, NifX n=1 Tax=Rhodospirillum centenum (strain ATCC 51521 / SW) TaxID=414684 RepID=B6IXK4_RHOCS|nr:nitrogen fixation protein NifX [Rhodospirillum centenum]ACJ01028.1 nitrogenase molybdenum-iron protein, NifX [Rhodospirillum centenum SW]